MKSASIVEFRRVVEGVSLTADFLESIGRPVLNSDDYFVHHAVNLLDNETRREWEKLIRVSQKPPSLDSLRSLKNNNYKH